MFWFKSLTFSIFILISLGGCVHAPKYNVTYKEENKTDFDFYVDNLEKKLRACYERETRNIFKFDAYLTREDYYSPRYSKLKLFYKGMPDYIGGYVNIMYILREKNINKVIVRDIDIEHPVYNKFGAFAKNGMECINEKY